LSEPSQVEPARRLAEQRQGAQHGGRKELSVGRCNTVASRSSASFPSMAFPHAHMLRMALPLGERPLDRHDPIHLLSNLRAHGWRPQWGRLSQMRYARGMAHELRRAL